MEELAASIEALLQSYYLSKYGATYSEYFYALRRAKPSEGLPIIGRREKLLSFLFELMTPYIRSKLLKV